MPNDTANSEQLHLLLIEAASREILPRKRLLVLFAAAEIETGIPEWFAERAPLTGMAFAQSRALALVLPLLQRLHHPNSARRLVDAATLAACAYLTGRIEEYRPALECALAYGEAHPTPAVRWHRHVRHVLMDGWVRVFLTSRDVTTRERVRNAIATLRVEQPIYEAGVLKGAMAQHTAYDLLLLYHLLGCLDEVIDGPGQGLDNARRATTNLELLVDEALARAAIWSVVAAAVMKT